MFYPTEVCIKCLEWQLKFENLQRRYSFLIKELDLYRNNYPRPIIVKEIIHHPAQKRTSTCLYGKPAWDEIIYE